MAATGIEVVINPPAWERRSRGLFVQVAHRLETGQFTPAKADGAPGADRLGLGVKHVPRDCGGVFRGSSECQVNMVDGQLIDPTDGTDLTESTKVASLVDCEAEQVHPAFKLVTGAEQALRTFPNDTTNGRAINNRLLERLANCTSGELAAELVTGYASGGASFSSESTVQGASTTVTQAARVLEGWLASVLHDAYGFVLLPPQLLHMAVEAGWVSFQSGQFRTATGHVVAADAGYLGNPTDPTAPAPATFTIYASSVPSYRVSEPMMLGDGGADGGGLDITTNVRQKFAEAMGQVVFDPCTVGHTVLTLA